MTAGEIEIINKIYRTQEELLKILNEHFEQVKDRLDELERAMEKLDEL